MMPISINSYNLKDVIKMYKIQLLSHLVVEHEEIHVWIEFHPESRSMYRSITIPLLRSPSQLHLQGAEKPFQPWILCMAFPVDEYTSKKQKVNNKSSL